MSTQGGPPQAHGDQWKWQFGPYVPPVSRETEEPAVDVSRETEDQVAAEARSVPAAPADSVAATRPGPSLSVEIPLSPAAAAPVSRETAQVDPEPQPWGLEDPLETPIARAAETAMRVRSGQAGEFTVPPTTRVLTVANQKGGVGKTTTTVNLAAALALHGLRVLVVDLDPQGNASTALGVAHHAGTPSVYEVLVEGLPMSRVVQSAEGIEGLFAVPATIDLAGAEIELVSLVARESRLQRALETYLAGLPAGQRIDYVFIDCPPSLGLLTVNAFVAAREVLIPIQCEYYALEGLGQLVRNVDLIRAHLNPALRISTILLTMYDGRTRLAAQVAAEVRAHFGAQVLPTAVPRSVRVSEAPGYAQTVMTYDPGSSGALAYLEAARELADSAAGLTAYGEGV